MSNQEKIHQIGIDLIRPGIYQARKRFDPDSLKELSESIAESGIIQPVVLRTLDDGYELLAGERRWRATQLAGLSEIPALIRDDLDDREAYVLGLIENLQRESLSPMETARGLRKLGDTFTQTHQQMAERIGKSRVYVTNFLRLLKLEDRVQDWVDEGLLSMGHARALAALPAGRQSELAAEAISKKLSVRALESRCKSLPKRMAIKTSKESFGQLEQSLSEFIGNPVTIDFDPNRGKGEIHIRFHGLDEFDGILQRWGYQQD